MDAPGTSFKDIYWTLGSYDIVAVLEPRTTRARRLRCSRSLLRTTTLRAFGRDEMARITGRAS